MKNKYKIIEKNTKALESLVKQIKKEKNINSKLKLIELTSYFLSHSTSKYFSCVELEKEICKLSKILFKDINSSLKKNKYLIIMTEAYSSGGHTRLVEKLIASFPEDKFDLIFTRKESGDTIPKSLLQTCKNKNCQIFFPKSTNFILRAKFLREISINYSKIILFIHPEDFIPILAFGTEGWKVPIILYNHADHRGWLGVSISDIVINMSTESLEFSKKHRKIKNNIVIPIPINKIEKDEKKKLELRRELNIPQNHIVFYSAGSHFKYTPANNIDFRNVIDILLKNIPNSSFVIVGVEENNKFWKTIKLRYNERIKLIKSVPFKEYLKYYNIADIYIDSMPMSGFTVLLEAASIDIPIVFVKTPLFFPDSIKKLGLNMDLCNFQYDKILNRVLDILNNKYKYSYNLEEHRLNNFSNNFRKILESSIRHERNLNYNPKITSKDKKILIEYANFLVYLGIYRFDFLTYYAHNFVKNSKFSHKMISFLILPKEFKINLIKKFLIKLIHFLTGGKV